MLETRRLGRSGLTVSRLGFGGAAMGIEGYLTDERRDDDAVRERARAPVSRGREGGGAPVVPAPPVRWGRPGKRVGGVRAAGRGRGVG
ncbi:MAG: hypothetical protein ABWY78_22805, partial [Microvirga sp.]